MVVKITMRRVRALDRSKVEITEAGPYGEFLFEERQIPHCISIALGTTIGSNGARKLAIKRVALTRWEARNQGNLR
jgi:hypothetical protein